MTYRPYLSLTLAALLLLAAPVPHGAAQQPTGWWRGNLHTHSLWSDGEDFPEMIAAWYRSNGYHFVAFTEHDMLQQAERWVDINAPDDGWPPRNESARRALPAYRERFGDHVEERIEGGRHLVRLRALEEYRLELEQPGRFLLLMGEEITDREGAHVNVVEPRSAILPRGGAGPADRIRANLGAVAAQADSAGRPLLAVVNHPNFVWSLTAEEIAAIPQARFFEVYNGHALVHNDGDGERAGTERIWDVALSLRLAEDGPLLYGVANDDAHHYGASPDTIARPGRGWIQVRADTLTAEHLIEAILAGDFYASTGVALHDVRCDATSLTLEIEPVPGASYRTTFIGTRRGASLESTPVTGPDGAPLRTTRRYGHEVGAVLSVVDGTTASYVFDGDELYVRARVESSLPHIDPTTGSTLGVQRAWTQPVTPGRVLPRCGSGGAGR